LAGVVVVWHSFGTVVAAQSSMTLKRDAHVAVAWKPEGAMDVGITKSNKNSPFHFVTGMLVVTVGYTAVMFAVRAFVMG
jgi:hypothetical protein